MPSPALSSTWPVEVKLFETDVAAVTGGNDNADGGWVSGSPASLAASGIADCIFDLGPNWRRITTVQVSVTPAGPSTGANVLCSGSDTAAFNANRRLNLATATSAGAGQVTFTSSQQSYMVRPMGRYFVVRYTNTDGTNAVGASAKVTVALYPY